MFKPSPEKADAPEKAQQNERLSKQPFNRAFLWVAIFAVLAVSVSGWLYLRPGPLRCYQVMRVLNRNPSTVEQALIEMESYTFDGFAQATLADPQLASTSVDFKLGRADAKANPSFWKTHWYGAHSYDEVTKVYVVDTWLRPILDGGDVGASFLLLADANGNLLGWIGPVKC